MAVTTAAKKGQKELRLEELDVFALPAREALTSCGGSFLSVDVDVRIDLNLGGGCCHPCHPCG
ncbi:MAG TPA: hypothetical protein VFA70_04555 [Dehalococcoidia bacterium]|nr:hypothetical protein [Dehalococcoidia bacterium]